MINAGVLFLGGGGWTPYALFFLMLYVSLCISLRFKRRDAMECELGFSDRESLSRMTNNEAQIVTAYLSELEFPKVYYTSVQFALFKTYGIPTISDLLVATKQFSTPQNASRRYADTAILIQEFTSHQPCSERAIKALARMNYIHSRYQKSGKISNEDLLYTLSVFITEPVTWIKRYEWRAMTDMEICAVATLWKSIGDAMGIEYKGNLAHDYWKNGLEFYDDIKAWAEAYEAKNMVPALSNKITADELVPLLLFYVPKLFRHFARNIVHVLMGPRLRAAMMYPTPSKFYFTLANFIFGIRQFLLRYFSLPRPNFLRVREIMDHPNPRTGRYHPTRYLVHPWYIKPDLLNCWGPEGWFVWFFGGDIPGSKGNMYMPEGYSLEDIGPESMKGKGKENMMAWQQKLERERPSGCPFAFG